jgi:hypothetical protein
MRTPSISIYGTAAAVVALLAALLWYLSARRFRMASTSQELLDFFEDRQSVREVHGISILSDEKDKAPESAPAASAIEWLQKETNRTNRERSLGVFVSAEKATGPLSLRSLTVD